MNFHLHTIALDGVYVDDAESGGLRFRRIGEPSEQEVLGIAWAACKRTLATLRKSGRWTDADDEHGGGFLDGEDEFSLQEPLLAEVYNASISGRLALGKTPAIARCVLVRKRCRALRGLQVHCLEFMASMFTRKSVPPMIKAAIGYVAILLDLL